MAETRLAPLVTRVLGWLAALAGPALLTAALVHVQSPQQRDYVFLYLGVVAVLGVLSGLWPAAVAAALTSCSSTSSSSRRSARSRSPTSRTS